MPLRRTLNFATSNSPATLVLARTSGESQPFSLSRAVTLIGSREDVDIRLESRDVSRFHAVILHDGRSTWIRDLSSRKGTTLNGRSIREAELSTGDVICIAGHQLRFESSPLEPAPDAAGPGPLTLQMGNETRSFNGTTRVISVGRRAGNDIHVGGQKASSTHAVLCRMGDRWFLCDLKSRTGAFLNQARVSQAEIGAGDLIQLGETKMRVLAQATQGPKPLQKPRPTDAHPAPEQSNSKQSSVNPAASIDEMDPLVLDQLFGAGGASEAAEPQTQARKDAELNCEFGPLATSLLAPESEIAESTEPTGAGEHQPARPRNWLFGWRRESRGNG